MSCGSARERTRHHVPGPSHSASARTQPVAYGACGSLRERVVRELAAQPVDTVESGIEVASAHLYDQSRRDAFDHIAARDALMVDAEPQNLGIELVNRYQAVKKAGMI